MIYKGIDVSKWQGRINWSLVKSDDVQFAMIRSSFGWGKDNVDILFETNYEGAKKVGIPVGAYHYSYARTVAEAVKEAEHCYSVIKGKSFEYPIAYDLEESSVAALGKERVSQIAKAFCEKMESYGYYVCIYSGKHWFENYFTDEIFERYDIWLAQWNNRPTFNKPYGIWQKSSKGRVNGIMGYVDLNESYKHYPSIMKFNGLNGYKKSTTEKEPEKEKPVIKDIAAGQEINLEKTELYASSTSKKEINFVRGKYYLYDGKVLNGRVRITNSKENVNRKPINKYVTGYINKEWTGERV